MKISDEREETVMEGVEPKHRPVRAVRTIQNLTSPYHTLHVTGRMTTLNALEAAGCVASMTVCRSLTQPYSQALPPMRPAQQRFNPLLSPCPGGAKRNEESNNVAPTPTDLGT